jgi:hypothetical protein
MTQAAAQVMRPPESDPLGGLRVLFLPKNSRVPYFEGLLAAARRDHQWAINIVCPPISVESWRRAVDPRTGFTLVPDFNKAAPWEQDPAAIDEIDNFIGECERASGVPAGRILLAGERDIGRGFSEPSFYWFSNKASRRALADNTTPFVYVRRIFAFARETIRTTKPELIISGEWADPICFIFYLVARRLGIRCIVNRHSKIWSGRCFWSDDPGMNNAPARQQTAERGTRKAPVSERAQQRIASFRATPTTSAYVRARWDVLERNWLGHHVDLARAFAVELRHYLQRRDGPAPKPALQLLLDHYRQPVLRWRQARFFRRIKNDELSDTRYIYVSLHKDPELGLNYQAPFWYDQYTTVALVATTLPTGYKLIVREHRKNMGRRPTRWYKDLSRLPGVVLVDAFDDQFKYISNAEMVVTENGSDGWEGILLGRRVITLADNFFDSAELARRVRDPEQLAAIVVDMLKKQPVIDSAYDRALGWLLDAEWETTVPNEAVGQPETFKLLASLLPQAAHRLAEPALLTA